MATQREKEIAICRETLRITDAMLKNGKVSDMTTKPAHSAIHRSLTELQAALQPHRTRTLESALSGLETALGIHKAKPDATRLASVGGASVLQGLEAEFPALDPASRADEKTIFEDARLIDRVCQFKAVNGLGAAWGAVFQARAHRSRLAKNNPRQTAMVDEAQSAIEQAESNLKRMTKLAKLMILKG
jgi:hypothetical protein